MKRTIVAMAWAIAVVAGLVVLPLAAQPRTAPAPKGAAPAPRVERTVPFRAGEVLTYDVSWSSYVTAGTATVAVREKRPSFGSTAYYIVAEGRPTPLLSKLYTLYYKADTLLDAYSLLPQRGSIYSEEGRDRRTKTLSFNQSARTAVYEVQTATKVRKDLALPPYTQDALSAIYVLRAIPLKPGASVTIPVSDSGKTYKVTVAVGGQESVKTGLGTLSAWKISPRIIDEKGKPNTRPMAMWVSGDERRLPVKLQADLAVGSFQLTLREAR
jgi:hypothetical protein